MAKAKNESLGILTPDQRAELVKLSDQIAKSETALSVMKELGIGVRDLEEKLLWAKRRSAILLEKG